MTQYKYTVDAVLTYEYKVEERRHWIFQYVDFTSPISNEKKQIRMVAYVAEDEETVILHGSIWPNDINTKISVANEIAKVLREEVGNMEDLNEKRKQEFLDSLKGEYAVSLRIDLEAQSQSDQDY